MGGSTSSPPTGGTALLFGGLDVADPAAPLPDALLAAARRALGQDPCALRDAPGDLARLARGTLAGIAAWQRLGAPRPSVIAAHSVGVYGALVAAGALSVEGALGAVAACAARAASHAPPGDLMGVLGMEAGEALALVPPEVALAAHNGPGHLLLGGPAPALDEAGEALRRAGALSVRRLGLAHAYHTPALHAAAQALVADLRALRGGPAQVPILLGYGAPAIRTEGSGWEGAVAAQLAAPLDWPPVAAALAARAPDAMVDLSPGRLLTKMLRRSARPLPRRP